MVNLHFDFILCFSEFCFFFSTGVARSLGSELPVRFRSLGSELY
jgi:hypothetical protein